jgi:hypothetical protein
MAIVATGTNSLASSANTAEKRCFDATHLNLGGLELLQAQMAQSAHEL